MKIADITAFLVDSGTADRWPGWEKNWLFVRVRTTDGLCGWGECYTSRDRDTAVKANVEELAKYAVGTDARQIRHFRTIAYRDFSGKRGSVELFSAMSGIEQACWDLLGKYHETPVYNLLGGPCRDAIRVYANGWSYARDWERNQVDALAERASELVRRGFTALKFDPFQGPWREFLSRRDEDLAVECVRAVREAVGPDVDVLIEAQRRLAQVHAIRIAERLEEFSPFWLEEPVSSRNLPALANVRKRSNTPIVTGEEIYTKREFRGVFEVGAADIVNPDVANCGGILELVEIGAMAEAHSVAVAPHNYNSTTMALAATVQASAVLPTFVITEYFVNFEARGREITVDPLELKNGYIPLPTTPGLGLELDESALTKFGRRELPKKWIPAIAQETHVGDSSPSAV